MKFNRILIQSSKRFLGKLRNQRERNRWYRKIRKITRQIPAQKVNVRYNIKGHREKWAPLSKKVNTRWYKAYSRVSGQEDINYVPEDIYYMIIEPKLNRCDFNSAYKDKNFFDKYLTKHRDIFPKVLLRNIEGLYYDNDYQPVSGINVLIDSWQEEKIVLKPSIDTGGGRNLSFFSRNKDHYISNRNQWLTENFLRQNYKRNFLIQSVIRQHSYFSAFNETSLNTIRMTTYRSVVNNEVIHLHSNLRMGGKGSQVDNQNAGGVAIHIDDFGNLSHFATNRIGEKFYAPPANPELKFSGLGPVPKFEEMKKIAKAIAREYYYFRMLGFDFCLDDQERIKLIELNCCGLGINFQMDSGSLFKEYTDEVIQFCLK